MPKDPKALQNHALQAEKHLEALATGLAQQGADDQIVNTVTKMAEVTRKVVSAMGDVRGEGPPEGQPQEESPPEEAAPEAAAPAQEREAPPHHTLHSAAQALHQDVRKRAQERQASGTY